MSRAMPAVRFPRVILALVAAGSTGLVAACARQGAPPGGPEDHRPPVVVSTSPEPFEVLTEPFRGPVRFRFDERVSERLSRGYAGRSRTRVAAHRGGAGETWAAGRFGGHCRRVQAGFGLSRHAPTRDPRPLQQSDAGPVRVRLLHRRGVHGERRGWLGLGQDHRRGRAGPGRPRRSGKRRR